MTDILSRIDATIAERRGAELAVVERAVEAALQGGKHGVRVRNTIDGVTAEVDPSVPYGYIYEHDEGWADR